MLLSVYRTTSEKAETATSVAVPAGDIVQSQVQPVLHRVAGPITRNLSFCRVAEDRSTVGSASKARQHVLRVLQSRYEVSQFTRHATADRAKIAPGCNISSPSL